MKINNIVFLNDVPNYGLLVTREADALKTCSAYYHEIKHTKSAQRSRRNYFTQYLEVFLEEQHWKEDSVSHRRYAKGHVPRVARHPIVNNCSIF